MTEERRKTPRENDLARTECYQQIRDCMKKGLARFYRENPDLAGDDRSKAAIDRSMEGLRCVFAVLDHFKIGRE